MTGPGFIAGGVCLYVLFHALYMLVPNTILAEIVYCYGITMPAAWIINAVEPTVGAYASLNHLRSAQIDLEIVRGCDGSGALFIACAAMLAFRAGVGAKLIGVLSAFMLVAVLNEMRVVVLFFVLDRRPEWFTLLHTYLMPLLFVAAVCGLFLWWIRYVAQRDTADAAMA